MLLTQGWTPLSLAVQDKVPSMVKLLLAAKAAVNIRDNYVSDLGEAYAAEIYA